MQFEAIALSLDPNMVLEVFAAFMITVAIEMPLVDFMLKKWKLPHEKIIALFANIITLPIIWFMLSLKHNNEVNKYSVIGFTVMVIVESVYYYLSLRNQKIKFTQVVLLGFYANLASVVIPVLVFFIMALLLNLIIFPD